MESSFKFVTHWKTEQPENNERVLAFWKSEGALTNESQAVDRLSQVVMHATDANGDVAGVCTVTLVTHPRLGQPMYYFRCFVGKAWRKSSLVIQLLHRTQDLLEEYARANDYPAIGILLELENKRFESKGLKAMWSGFAFIGKSQRNLDLRVYYFKGARLKKTKPGA